ncbi:MAG: LIC_13355 family lipoprotein [Sandaracinaceae bacterium]
MLEPRSGPRALTLIVCTCVASWLASGCAMTVSRSIEASRIVDAPGASPDRPFGDPELAINGVRGGGAAGGSLDVYSIRYGDALVLGWDGEVLDGEGDDLVVFENSFDLVEGRAFMDPIVVEVSADGERWVAFPHDYVAEDETRYSNRREDWVGFAGVQAVYLNADTNPLDPFDAEAGGDRFDLAALGDGPDARAVLDEGVRFIRLTPAPDHENPDTGAPFLRDPASDGPDIDGVAARYVLGASS